MHRDESRCQHGVLRMYAPALALSRVVEAVGRHAGSIRVHPREILAAASQNFVWRSRTCPNTHSHTVEDSQW